MWVITLQVNRERAGKRIVLLSRCTPRSCSQQCRIMGFTVPSPRILPGHTWFVESCRSSLSGVASVFYHGYCICWASIRGLYYTLSTCTRTRRWRNRNIQKFFHLNDLAQHFPVGPSCCRRGTSLSRPYSRCGVYSQHTSMCPLSKGLRELAAVLSGPQLEGSHVEFMQRATPRFPSFAVFSRDIGAVSV